MTYRLILAALFAAAVVFAQDAPVSVPKTTGPIPVAADSYPFLGAGHVFQPVDFKKAGYVEEEYFISGNANVYDWNTDGSLSVKAEKAPYTTRVLVRRPANASRFSGNVVVEPAMPARRYDWSLMWGYIHQGLIDRGDAWVGVTLPATSDSLKKFNPARYASISFANPNPTAACPGAGKNGPSATEDGLRMDELSQVGAALKSPGGPFGNLKVEAIFMTTQGGDLLTYMDAIHPRAKLANGKNVYDGYLARNPGNVQRLNQCAPAPVANDPRGGFKHQLGVPVIAVVAQGEVVASRWLRRPDSDDAADKFRLYEIAGVGHIDKAAYAGFPTLADQTAIGAAQGTVEWPFNVTCDPAIPMLEQPALTYAYDAAFQHLFNWARKGVPPPKAERIQIKEDVGEFVTTRTVALDEFGNGLGGVRTPYVEAPTASYFTTSPGPGACAEMGRRVTLDSPRLTGMYPNAKAYTAKVTQTTDRLVKEGWMTEVDAKRVKAELNALPH